MWGQLWGSMTWGVATVPMLGPTGLAFLIGGLLGAAAVLYRKQLSKAAATCAVVALAIAPLMSLATPTTLPHSFMNGTVAEAGEVNANFEELRDAFNATSGRLGPFRTLFEGPFPTGSDCQGKLVGEVWLFAGTFEPRGAVFARGQLLSVSQYPVLFSVLSNNYGGDGRTTFAVPDLGGLEPDGVSHVVCVKGIYPSRNE